MKILILALPTVLLLVAGCGSSSEAPGGGGGSSCVPPVVNAPCSAGEIPCATAVVPLPASQCDPCQADPHWKSADGCVEAQGWGCMSVGDTSIWAFSGAIVCQSPDGGTSDSGTMQ